MKIQIPEFVAGVKALGLISRHLTGPLWSLLENKDLHILDMNEKYLQLVKTTLSPSWLEIFFALGMQLLTK